VNARPILVCLAVLASHCNEGKSPTADAAATSGTANVPTSVVPESASSTAPALPAAALDATPESGPAALVVADAAPDADDSGAGGACPSGMALVDGEYCSKTDWDSRCKKSWYAKWNDKKVCLEFEPPIKCIGKKTKRRFCIDKYEYPNKPGVRPTVMNDFYMAQRICAEQGKRTCTENEWTMACEGPEYKPYPYGYVRDPEACRGDQKGVEPEPEGKDGKGVPFYKFASKHKDVRAKELERLWQGVPSGSQPKCVSDYGVHDLPGNADELAASEEPEAKYDNVTIGGPWRYGVRNQCRPRIYTHNEGFAYYYLSFRCCAEADGKPTDPRAPRQIRRKDKWNGGKPAVYDSWDGDPMPEPARK
jgi:sulfatase modifying factor 1